MESLNSFNKGMNKDTNPLNIPKGSYIDANNVRLINDAGNTSMSINNVLGNDYQLTIPDSPLIQKITIVAEAVSNLVLDGQTGSAALNTAGATGETLYDYVVNDVNYTNCAQNVGASNPTYNIYYNSNYIIVVPIISSYYVPIAVGASFTLDSSFVLPQTGLEVIGSTTIRDDIYLYTTNCDDKNPGGHSIDSSLAVDPSSVGVIWKMTYNKITSVVDPLELIYAGYIDWSTYYAIPPSATLGRYENSSIQRLYFTDFYNKLRSLNVGDPQCLAFDPSVLDVSPSTDFDIPLLQSLQSSSGNDLKVGTIQCAYRLKNTSGAITTFSELSNIVTLVPHNETTKPFKDYIGGTIGTAVSKQIVWEINNLDRDYDRIEAVVLFKESPTGTPIISLLPDAPISGDSYTVVYDGTQDVTPVTLNEFLALSGSFTHCKTIETKDNRLFVANTRNQYSDIDYDARAYRFPTASNTLTITENGTPTAYDTTLPTPWSTTGDLTDYATTWGTIDEESDAINADGTINKYKKGGLILGGTGPNISYEFYTVALSTDVNTGAGSGNFGVADDSPAPWRGTNPRYEQNEINLNVYSPNNQGGAGWQEYPTYSPSIIKDGLKYPQYNGLFNGYQRNEIYRFGILFKNKSGDPIFVKWIGDIQMPDFDDVNSNSYYADGTMTGVQTGITDFRPAFVANKNGDYLESFIQQLGIKFTVYIPDEVQELISGYEIVRTDRTVNDKTIVSQGYNTKVDSSGGNYYTTSLATSSGGNDVFGGNAYDKGYYITPDLCNPDAVQPIIGHTLKVKGIVYRSNTKVANAFGAGDPYYMYKLYNWLTTPVQTGNIEQVTLLGYAGNTIDINSGAAVFNYDYDTVTPTTTTGYSIGNSAYYYRIDANLNYTPLTVPLSGAKYLINIERTLASQYGGNTYSARANNTYQSCSMLIPIRSSQLGAPDQPIVFGGDTFVNMYDSCRWSKNWGTTGRGVAAGGKYFAVFMLPIECSVNTDLRHGTYVNKDISDSYENAPGPAEFVETYSYNPIYSTTNNTKQYFPKPDPFILNEEYDTRFHASEIKINGELTDSWGVFLPNNYWDTEGAYGPINAITAMQDKMYFWQNKAFGTMSINPRVMVTDTGTDAQLQLGVGSVLQRHDYLSVEVGLQHQYGMTKSSNKLYWTDINKKKFYAFGGDGLMPASDVKGMFSWFNTYLKNNINITDKPVYFDLGTGVNGIRAVYDYKYNQAIFTFSDATRPQDQVYYTLVYDDFIDGFSSFMDYTPNVYITDNTNIFSMDPLSSSDLYMHDRGNFSEFYGTVYNTTIKLAVNDNYQYTKIFDNIMYDSQSLLYNSTYDNYQNAHDDTWETIRIYNDYQNTDYQAISLISGLKRKERTWQMQIPRNRVLYTGGNSPNIFDPAELSLINKAIGERMRDKYITIDLLYNNSSNRLLTCNNFRTLYRISAR